jgi:pSer/pThr/pTyr-binding forkhead associated (FHA) protein
MSPLRVLRGFVFGALGGVLGWLLVEFLFQPARFERPGMVATVTPHQQGLLGIALGLAIGGFLGISEGLAEGTMSRFRRAFFTFLVLGAAGGYVGLYFGQILFGRLGGEVDVSRIPLSQFFPQLLIRSVSWMLIGLFLGVVFGVPNLSVRRMWNGAIGGGIGGFLGGFVFQVLVFTRVFQGPQVRFLGFVIIGAAIGFFINLIAEALKRVWVKVLIGRNEGREHVLDTPLAYVGRDELADVPVFLDPSVPKRMASFRLTGGRYALHPESSALPILVNGQPLAQGQVLRDGDAIQFGRITLAYFEKATATGMARPVDRVALADFSMPSVVPGATPIPTGANVCEFCGQQRDPATGACACSVADAGYAPGPAGYPQADPGYGADPQMGYGGMAAGGYPQGDPAYAATVMDPGPAPAYSDFGAPEGPRLVAVAGPHAGQAFPLYAAELGIGRDPGQEIPLPSDTTASRRHARVFAGGGGWILRDEGSSNGTWINGVRVQEQTLFPGDVVRVGQTEFRFEA